MSNPISNMVNRFLCWKLPRDFSPDAGITFIKNYPFESPHWPIGTNLLTAFINDNERLKAELADRTELISRLNRELAIYREREKTMGWNQG